MSAWIKFAFILAGAVAFVWWANKPLVCHDAEGDGK